MPPPKVRLARLRLPLSTPRLLLRSYSFQDASRIFGWFQDREITRTIPLWEDYTLGDGRDFVLRSRRSLRSGEAYNLAITLRGTGELIGGVGLEILSPRERRAHIGYWVARPYWGQGVASEAASRVCQEALRTLRMHRIETGVARGNPASRKVLARLGFRSEGWARDRFLIDGRYRDCEMMGLLAEEFRPYRAPPRALRTAGDPEGISSK